MLRFWATLWPGLSAVPLADLVRLRVWVSYMQMAWCSRTSSADRRCWNPPMASWRVRSTLWSCAKALR